MVLSRPVRVKVSTAFIAASSAPRSKFCTTTSEVGRQVPPPWTISLAKYEQGQQPDSSSKQQCDSLSQAVYKNGLKAFAPDDSPRAIIRRSRRSKPKSSKPRQQTRIPYRSADVSELARSQIPTHGKDLRSKERVEETEQLILALLRCLDFQSVPQSERCRLRYRSGKTHLEHLNRLAAAAVSHGAEATAAECLYIPNGIAKHSAPGHLGGFQKACEFET